MAERSLAGSKIDAETMISFAWEAFESANLIACEVGDDHHAGTMRDHSGLLLRSGEKIMSDTPYDRGFAAYQQEQPTSSCEHPIGSGQGREWVRGWTDGQAAERVKLGEARGR